MIDNIICRKDEIKELLELYKSKSSQFVVVYGRRRVGKTFLIRELFEEKFTFYHTALSPIEYNSSELNDLQINAFVSTLRNKGAIIEHKPENWFVVFEIFKKWLNTFSKRKRILLFFDELPWLDTPKSGFITAFENFWNSYLDGKNVMLIVSGSAVSWINDNLINSYGGLYDRVTREIKLSQFTLYETEQYIKSKNISMSRTDILECYMVLGGIPFYLSCLKKGYSLSQNIDNLFFNSNSKLGQEFVRLFGSQFKNSEEVEKILRFLSGKRIGYTRKEISEKTKISLNGRLTKLLKSLEVSEFISSYVYFSHSKRDVYYFVSDLFIAFWFYFKEKKIVSKDNFWKTYHKSAVLTIWRGLAFEQVCFIHKEQIKKKLGISGVSTEFSPWLSKKDENIKLEDKTKVDMVIQRGDNIVNLCEIKYYNKEFAIDKQYDQELRDKMTIFVEQTKVKNPQLTIITTYGLKFNEYSNQVQSVVVLDDLFE
ncbi:MAG: ATP-binding protein [Bacteroidales bacterium]|nr:ATP-binding protein [Bacteroidales bacterium]